MLKVNNGRCIRNVSLKSMMSNRRRNIISVVAIALTTLLLTTLFSIGGSIIKHIQNTTMYQVGTSAHGGFKFISWDQYETLKRDKKIKDISYNVLIGYAENEELLEELTEVRFTEEKAAAWSFSKPTTGRLPEKLYEAALPTAVLDKLGIRHELGEEVELKIQIGDRHIIQTFTVCGFWEKPAATLTNEIYLSGGFQEEVAPKWKNNSDVKEHLYGDGFDTSGSVNPTLWFSSPVNIQGQINELKARCGFGKDVNDGANWAYFSSSFDPTGVIAVIMLLLLIVISGYLIIYNIFYISVSGDIRFYALLKTTGATDRQLKWIVYFQAFILSLAGVPLGLPLGYLLSAVLLPIITQSFMNVRCEIYTNLWIFISSAAFAGITVWISCIKPCRFVKKTSPVQAVSYTDAGISVWRKNKRTHAVTLSMMAWENICRTPQKTAAVVISLALSILVLNCVVSLVKGFDKDKYIKSYVLTDFSVCDQSLAVKISNFWNFEGVSPEDMKNLSKAPGITDFGAVYMALKQQDIKGDFYDRVKDILDRRYGDFENEHILRAVRSQIEDSHVMPSHIYGVEAFTAGFMEIHKGKMDLEKFFSSKYAVVSAYDDAAEELYYDIGDTISVNFPDGTIKDYEVLAVGDLSYALGPQFNEAMGINITIPAYEFLAHAPECKGAMKVVFNVKDEMLKEAESFVSDYCGKAAPSLAFQSKTEYAKSFKSMVNMFLLVGGALSFILALIGLLNFVNLTVTSITSRQNELAILQAVGMTGKQLRAMLVYEGIFKLLLTALFSLTIGRILSYYILRLLTAEMWMYSYRFVIWPTFAGVSVFLILAILIPYVCCLLNCRRNIVERIREVN